MSIEWIKRNDRLEAETEFGTLAIQKSNSLYCCLWILEGDTPPDEIQQPKLRRYETFFSDAKVEAEAWLKLNRNYENMKGSH